jgi:preprotein translocase subunit SecG
MENVVLVIHLILALCLIGVVLLQRSEGGGLGIGGGGGGGVMTGRSAATALGKLTWIFAIGFLATSITLTVISARNSAGDSVIERLGTGAGTEAPAPAPAVPDDLLPPTTGGAPTLPPPVE